MENDLLSRVSANPKKPFRLQAPHVTTASFMEFQPVVAVELVPDTDGKLLYHSFLRADPMTAPSMGQLDTNLRAFFVRYASVWRPFYDFKTNTIHPNYNPNNAGIPTDVPTFEMNDVIRWIATTYASSITSGTFDLAVDGSNYKFNKTGRWFIKVLQSLGYDVYAINSGTPDNYVSALPLLCYAKIFIDWYVPSQYVRTDPTYLAIENLFMSDQSYILSLNSITQILGYCYHTFYDADYLNSAWDKPNSPTSGAFTSISLTDPSLTQQVTANIGSTGAVVATQAASTNLATLSPTTYANMMALAQYLKRHQIAGSLALDRWLLDYGVAIRADKLGRSLYLGSSINSIKFGEVMSSSDTSGAVLGAYAGAGIGGTDPKNPLSVDVHTGEDYGMLIVIQTLDPNARAVQGYRRHVKHITKFDFYEPVFDGKGVQAVDSAEVYASSSSPSFNATGMGQVFGYIPRYAEYKELRPMLTGDFRFPSVNVGLEAFHLFRIFDDAFFSTDARNIKHSVNFLAGDDASQYRRMFYESKEDSADPFKVIGWVDLRISAPMLPLYDDYLFHDDDDHKMVKLSEPGPKMN